MCVCVWCLNHDIIINFYLGVDFIPEPAKFCDKSFIQIMIRMSKNHATSNLIRHGDGVIYA